MSMNQTSSVPSASEVLKLRRPMSVAIYDEYTDAQHAVDYLADRQFPVANLAIVGTDLKSFEKVTGRMSWGRVLLAGFLNGIMWAGMFAVVMWMLNPSMSLVNALVIALVGFGLFGMGMAAIQYRMRGRARDYTSLTGIVATHYEVLAESDFADRARHLLSGGQAHGTRAIGRVPDERPYPGSSQPATQPGQPAPVDLGTLPPPYGQQPSAPAGAPQPAPGSTPTQWGTAWGTGPASPPAQSGQPAAGPAQSGDQPDAQAHPNAAELPYGQYWSGQGSEGIGDLPESLRDPAAPTGEPARDQQPGQGGQPQPDDPGQPR